MPSQYPKRKSKAKTALSPLAAAADACSTTTSSATVPLLKALDPAFRQPANHAGNLRPVDTSSNASLAHLRSCALSRLQSSWDSIIHRYSNTCFEKDDEIDLQTLEVVSHGSILSHPRTIAFGSLTGYLDDVDADDGSTSVLPNSNLSSTTAALDSNQEDEDADEDEEDNDGDTEDNDDDTEDDELITLAHSTTARVHSARSAATPDDDDNLLLLAIRSLRPPLVIVHDDDSDEEDELLSFAPAPPSRATAAATTTTTTTPNSTKASSQLLMDAIASASSPMPLASSPMSMYAPSPSSTSFNPLASPIPRARLSRMADTPCPIPMNPRAVIEQHDTPVPKGKAKPSLKAKTKTTPSVTKQDAAPVRRSSRLSLSSTLPDPDPLPTAKPPAPKPTSIPKPEPKPKPKSKSKEKPKSKSRSPPPSIPTSSSRPVTQSMASSSSSHSPPSRLDSQLADPPPMPARRRTRASVAAALDPPPDPTAELPPTRARKPPPAAAPVAAKPKAKPVAASAHTLTPPRPPPPPLAAFAVRKRTRNASTVIVTVSSDSDSEDAKVGQASPPRKRARKTNVPNPRRPPYDPETPMRASNRNRQGTSPSTPVESPMQRASRGNGHRQSQPELGSSPHAPRAPPPRPLALQRPRVAPVVPATTASLPPTPVGAKSVKHATQPVEHVWQYSYAAAMETKRKRAEALARARARGELTREQEILSLGGVVWAEMDTGTDTEDELVKGAVVVRGFGRR